MYIYIDLKEWLMNHHENIALNYHTPCACALFTQVSFIRQYFKIHWLLVNQARRHWSLKKDVFSSFFRMNLNASVGILPHCGIRRRKQSDNRSLEIKNKKR